MKKKEPETAAEEVIDYYEEIGVKNLGSGGDGQNASLLTAG